MPRARLKHYKVRFPVESVRRQMKLCWIKYIKNCKNPGQIAVFRILKVLARILIPEPYVTTGLWIRILLFSAEAFKMPTKNRVFCFLLVLTVRYRTFTSVCKENKSLKGPKHDQVGYDFFYIMQTRMVRWLGDWQKIFLFFIWGRYAPSCIFSECWADAKNIKRTISVRLIFFSVCSA
jgi:hypothetical protein